jgi:cell division protein FtsL
MFLRIIHVLSLLILIASAVAVYKVKFDTTYEAQRIAKLRSEIRGERDRLALLRAEWTRLAAPQRIQDLASRHLGMKPLQITRIADLSGLPERPLGPEDGDPIGEFIDRISPGEGQRDQLGEFLRAINGERGEAAAESKP